MRKRVINAFTSTRSIPGRNGTPGLPATSGTIIFPARTHRWLDARPMRCILKSRRHRLRACPENGGGHQTGGMTNRGNSLFSPPICPDNRGDLTLRWTSACAMRSGPPKRSGATARPSPFGEALLVTASSGLCGLGFVDPGDRAYALADMQWRWLAFYRPDAP